MKMPMGVDRLENMGRDSAFSRIIHLSDLLDRAYGAKGFTEDIFNKACGYLHKNEGTVVDKECVDAFLQAFPLPHFLTLGEDSFEKTLWEKIPRIKQELSFAQIKELARFLHRSLIISHPLPAPIPLVWRRMRSA